MKVTFEKNNIVINEEKIFPMAFRSFCPQVDTIKNFYANGIRLFSVFPSGIKNTLNEPYSQFGEVWIGEGVYDFAPLDKQVDMLLENAPDSYFSLMIHLDTRDWFLEKYPECKNSFYQINQSANCYKWIDEAEKFSLAMIAHVKEKYPEKMYAVFLFAGCTCEWFSDFTQSSLEVTENFEKAFRKFTNDHSAKLPNFEEVIKTEHGILRDPISQNNALQYWKFHNEQVSKLICRLAETIKTENQCLVGVFYGYLIGLANAVVSRGHNDLKRILNCKNIDLLFAPANYIYRGKDSTSGSFIPLESVKLHQKKYFHEIDNTSYLVNQQKQALRLQRAGHRRFESFAENITYFHRENAFNLAHGQGCWWFDMCSGWYDSPEMMNEIQKIKKVNDKMSYKDLGSVAEIAVFTDQTSNYYLNVEGGLTYSLVTEQVEELYKIGTMWDSFLADDLLNEQMGEYKLYIFLNLLAPSDSMRKKINQLKSQGKNFLFLYGSGYITDNGFSLESMSELVGMQFAYSGLEYVEKAMLPNGKLFGFCDKTTPSFTTFGEQILAVYEGTNIPAYAIKERKDGFTAWSGVGAVKASQLKELAKKAGVFIYSESDDPVYINKSMFGLYSNEGGMRTIHMPYHVILKSLYTDEEYCGTKIEIPYSEDEMKLFEIQKIAKTEMRNPNTLHMDKMSTVNLLKNIHHENQRVLEAIDECMEELAQAVDAVHVAFCNNGRLFYVGAGTSGRLGVVDAAECPPTFGVSKGQVIGIIAGGNEAMASAIEGCEDNEDVGIQDLSVYNITDKDVVVGISAAGNASYVVGAMKHAKNMGATTVSLTCNDGTRITKCADISIITDTGPEALTGSTRLKAGTAQKIVLNLISTGAMIKSGKVYENLMINVQPSNKKLLERCIRMICDLTGVNEERAAVELEHANNSIRKAIERIKEGVQ